MKWLISSHVVSSLSNRNHRLILLPEGIELMLKTGTPSDMLRERTHEAQGAFKNLMTHWSCDSHYVSHFAAFFIVVGAKTSVAESVWIFGFFV